MIVWKWRISSQKACMMTKPIVFEKPLCKYSVVSLVFYLIQQQFIHTTMSSNDLFLFNIAEVTVEGEKYWHDLIAALDPLCVETWTYEWDGEDDAEVVGKKHNYPTDCEYCRSYTKHVAKQLGEWHVPTFYQNKH